MKKKNIVDFSLLELLLYFQVNSYGHAPFINFAWRHKQPIRSLRGAVVMSLAMYTRGRRFDPGLLQSVGWDYKPMSRLHMTLVVGGTLKPKSTN